MFLLNFSREETSTGISFKKKVTRKNGVTRNLSSSVVEKFNGYEYVKPKLARKEKIDFTAIDIVYEPVFDENVPVPCFFTSNIHLAYRR